MNSVEYNDIVKKTRGAKNTFNAINNEQEYIKIMAKNNIEFI